MATEGVTPQPREPTPTTAVPATAVPATVASSLPQKRVHEDDHSPAVSSPLNPEVKSTPKVQVQAPEDVPSVSREKRTKKESLKKRESKGAGPAPDSTRATPDPKEREPPPEELAPTRYKLAPPKSTDFEPARGAIFTPHHDVEHPDGGTIEFCETNEQ